MPPLARFGPQAWLQQNGALGSMRSSVAADAAAAARAAEDANLKRKLAQASLFNRPLLLLFPKTASEKYFFSPLYRPI